MVDYDKTWLTVKKHGPPWWSIRLWK